MTASAVALATALAGLVIEAGPDMRLADLRWERRPILVFAEPGDPRLAEQLARFEAERAALEERDTLVIVDSLAGSALRRRFAPEGFTVILVGKDGGEKFRKGGPVDPATLTALIDTMPMRRREMRTDGGEDR